MLVIVTSQIDEAPIYFNINDLSYVYVVHDYFSAHMYDRLNTTKFHETPEEKLSWGLVFTFKNGDSLCIKCRDETIARMFVEKMPFYIEHEMRRGIAALILEVEKVARNIKKEPELTHEEIASTLTLQSAIFGRNLSSDGEVKSG